MSIYNSTHQLCNGERWIVKLKTIILVLVASPQEQRLVGSETEKMFPS
jgi:hypothetical protein